MASNTCTAFCFLLLKGYTSQLPLPLPCPAPRPQVAGYAYIVFYFLGLGAEILLVTLWLRLLPWLVGMPARWAAGSASVFSVAATACHTIFFSDVYEALLETPFMVAIYWGLGFRVRARWARLGHGGRRHGGQRAMVVIIAWQSVFCMCVCTWARCYMIYLRCGWAGSGCASATAPSPLSGQCPPNFDDPRSARLAEKPMKATLGLHVCAQVGRGVVLMGQPPLERTLVSFGAGCCVDSGAIVEGHFLEGMFFQYRPCQ